MELYYYEYSPFGVRTRMVVNNNLLPVRFFNLAFNDVKAHIERVGVKQTPFLHKDDNSFMLESMVICDYLNSLESPGRKIVDRGSWPEGLRLIEALEDVNEAIMSLPHFYMPLVNHPVNHQDFPDQAAKDYFSTREWQTTNISDKSMTQEEIDFITGSYAKLDNIAKENHILTIQDDQELCWLDLKIFPALRSATIRKECPMPHYLRHYLEYISTRLAINLYS